MSEWKGPFEDIKKACERWGIDTELEDAMSCSTCLHFKDDYNHSFDYPCRVCDRNAMGDMFVPWTPHFGEWVPVDNCLPDTEEMMLVSCLTKKGVGNVNRAYYSGGLWHGSGSMSGVVAWMPLPEPYVGGGDDD